MRNYVPVNKKKKTKVYKDGNYIIVKLYNTEIVKFNSREVVLNAGGWQTVTTKNRMNQVARENNLDISVGQVDGNWYVFKGQEVIEFVDGICIKLI
jgi:hypothetical protein